MRRLIYIPVIHTEEDMGSMAEPLKQQYVQQFGISKWQEHVRIVKNMWEGIRQRINRLRLNYNKVKIYQDGMPLCGKEMEIMEDVARLGSHNYRIIKDMVKKGALLLGTEDAKLLVEEYNLIKKITGIASAEKRRQEIKKEKERKGTLLAERDKFAANRIKETLKHGETGILFSGIEHEIDKYLPKDIKVEYLIYRLPFRAIQQ